MSKIASTKRSYTLTIEKTDFNRISEIAEKQRRSIAFIMNEAIKEYLQKYND